VENTLVNPCATKVPVPAALRLFSKKSVVPVDALFYSLLSLAVLNLHRAITNAPDSQLVDTRWSNISAMKTQNHALLVLIW
jgi:hypothetical protein